MYKRLLFNSITSLCFLAAVPAFAQQGTCGFAEQQKKLHAENPQLAIDRANFLNQHSETRVVNGKKRQVYVIPVVFHIIHEYGAENISDAQVENEMQILNEDYRKLNADTTEIVPVFKPIAGDAMIEFRLATIDPYGNPTNGIEHIYSHQTNQADNFSKLNQWHRNQYLNVWVVKNFPSQGNGTLLGYSHHPTDVTGGNFYIDGVIMLHSEVGKIGTAAGSDGRTLTHEIGHWLGLDHTWGGTNNPEVACGDDGVNDTPMTKGHFGVCPLADDECTAGVIENVQNHMEYSGCQVMFTEGQVTFMHNVLTQETSGRNNLFTQENLEATGTTNEDVANPPLAIPVADFSSSTRMVCVGEPVDFYDASWKATVSSYAWTFEGGSPATSTDENPTVTYSQDGYYDVTLTVTNNSGSHTKTFTNMIYVSGGWPEFTGPYNENFESGSAGWWITQNPEENHARFMLMPGVGKGLSKAYMLNNYKDVSQADAYTSDWFYEGRLGGSKDYLISPSYDLSNTTNVSISFDYAYGTRATTVEDITEEIRVYSSRDCGETWQLRSNATVDGAEILTAGYQDGNFVPTSDEQWATKTFTYTPTAQDTKIRFRFEFIASDKSSNFFFDNFNISGTLGIEENGEITGVSISPNPVSAGSEIAVQIDETSEEMTLNIVDVNGALISVINVPASNGTQTVMVPMNVAKGCYFLNAVKGNAKSIHRVIVF
jgi:PKD repeat protein